MSAPELAVIGLDGAMDSYVTEYAGRGELPNFARLMKLGCRLTDLRPPHPTVTPVCWASFITGATPEVNGIVSDRMHLSGDLSNSVSGYHGDFLLSERFWESAAKAGKTVLVDSFPVSGPLRDLSGNIWQLEGTSCTPGRITLQDGTEYEDIPQQAWLFDKAMNPVPSMKKAGFVSSPAERYTENGKEKITLHVKMDSPFCNRNRILPFNWESEYEEGGLSLFCEGEKIPLLPGEWAEGIRRTLPAEDGKRSIRLTFRFLLLPMPEGYLLFASAACYIRDRMFPEEFAVLSDDLPPTPMLYEYVFFNSPAYRIAIDSWRKHNDWHIALLRKALKKRCPNVVATYFEGIDTVNHLAWNIRSGAVKADEERKRFVEQAFLNIYKMADCLLGYFLDEVADEHTTILVLSDHGSIGVPKTGSINSILEKAGLLRYLDREAGIIDWGKTYAARCGFGHIFVNLAGREPNGIVPASEYNVMVDRIITALQDHCRSPEGASYLAFAARREEAGFFGLGCDRSGDVVFGLSAGHSAGTVHGEQIPSAQNSFGAMRCLGLLSGPGIPGNTVWEKPLNLIDLAPTLCARLSVPLPQGCNGRVVKEFVAGNS